MVTTSNDVHNTAAKPRLAHDLATGPRPWTRERVARLGYLIGCGWTAKRIAADPLIRSTPDGVYKQAQRCGLSLAAAPTGELRVRLPMNTLSVVERWAARAGLTPASFVRGLMVAGSRDPAAAGWEATV